MRMLLVCNEPLGNQISTNGLPIIIQPGGLLYEASSRIRGTFGAGEIGPATLERRVQTVSIMVAVHLSIWSVGFSITLNNNRTRFHFINTTSHKVPTSVQHQGLISHFPKP